MKKLMFALAFTFCAVMAFASNPSTAQQAQSLAGTVVQNDVPVPCLACAPCNGRIYCVFGLTCESANANLDYELKQAGCGGDTTKPSDDDDDSGE